MTRVGYLIDTSAFVRLVRDDDLRDQWQLPVRAGVVSTCPVTEMEILFSARSKAHRDELRSLLRDAFGWMVMPATVFERAAAVQDALVDRGAHRSAGPVDLLVAATAELHGLVLLHYDAHFDQIAAVTGQPMRRVAERGSVA